VRNTAEMLAHGCASAPDAELHFSAVRAKVKFLTAVWGDVYIERFATLALPSFLAPGNLPALASSCDLETIILTTRADFQLFETHPSFHALRLVCPVRFIDIDDLIAPGVYGVTLTLAYARAILECGEEMVKTHFVFMNADFVLADGSLRSLVTHIVARRSIVLGPSFRATAEALEPCLRRAIRPDSPALSMLPRTLVSLALVHPHPTTVAKTRDQGLCHSVQPNQFFWQIDEQALLGRYYLVFMLCLKPERVVTQVNSYCDYGFIPEMCPSGDEVMMGDSDEFFMLELQHRDQELSYLRLGTPSLHSIAESLSTWTTAEHRRAANYDIVFHVSEMDDRVRDAKSRAGLFIDRLGRMLKPPLSHIGHPSWVDAVAWFLQIREERGWPSPPRELGSAGLPHYWLSRAYVIRHFRRRIRAVILGFHNTLIGKPPRVTPASPHWLDYRHLRNILTQMLRVHGARILIVRERPEFVDDLLQSDERIQFASLIDVLTNGLPRPAQVSEQFTGVLIHLLYTEFRYVDRLVKQCDAAINGNYPWHLFVHRPEGAIRTEDLLMDILRSLEGSRGQRRKATICSYVGSPLQRLSHGLLRTCGRHYAKFGLPSLLWTAPLLSIYLPVALLGNLYLALRLPTTRSPGSSTSVLIQFG
jgi:hypothetical protein